MFLHLGMSLSVTTLMTTTNIQVELTNSFWRAVEDINIKTRGSVSSSEKRNHEQRFLLNANVVCLWTLTP